MSWNLDGSYFETCSCDVICPCTASLSLGATNDRCKVVLVFNVKSGEVDGTDVSGLTVAAVADTPKVMSDGNWRLGVVIDEAASDEQAEKLGGVFSGALGGPMEALGPLVGENLGVERAPIEVNEEGLTPLGPDRRRRRLRDRGRRALRGRDGRAREDHRHLPPGRLRADRLARHPLEDQRVRHPVRGQGGLLDLASSPGRPEPPSPTPPFAARRSPTRPRWRGSFTTSTPSSRSRSRRSGCSPSGWRSSSSATRRSFLLAGAGPTGSRRSGFAPRS